MPMTDCVNPDHDHMTEVDGYGADLPAPRPMTCNHCKRPTHYDEAVEQYVHDDEDTPGCFLIPGRPDGATPCEAPAYTA